MLIWRALCCKNRETNKNAIITKTLRNRAWISFSLLSFYRLFQVYTKKGTWFEEVERCSPDIFD